MAAALAVAGTEIVAVDAMQVYRGMDIGTAKPTAADRAARAAPLPRPRRRRPRTFTVADYRARRTTRSRSPTIAAADRCSSPAPACTSPRSSTASRCPAAGPRSAPSSRPRPTRRRCTQRLARARPGGGRDASSPANRRRIVRALEVTLGSGRPFSSYGPGPAGVPADRRRADRAALAARRRWPSASSAGCEAMMAAGLLDEVRRPRRRRAVAHRPPGARLQGAARPPRGRRHARRRRRRDRRCGPASSPSARSGGSVATPAYAGSTSTATRSPRWRRRWSPRCRHDRTHAHQAPRTRQRLPRRCSRRSRDVADLPALAPGGCATARTGVGADGLLVGRRRRRRRRPHGAATTPTAAGPR